MQNHKETHLFTSAYHPNLLIPAVLVIASLQVALLFSSKYKILNLLVTWSFAAAALTCFICAECVFDKFMQVYCRAAACLSHSGTTERCFELRQRESLHRNSWRLEAKKKPKKMKNLIKKGSWEWKEITLQTGSEKKICFVLGLWLEPWNKCKDFASLYLFTFILSHGPFFFYLLCVHLLLLLPTSHRFPTEDPHYSTAVSEHASSSLVSLSY